jgi:hypothetical protein
MTGVWRQATGKRNDLKQRQPITDLDDTRVLNRASDSHRAAAQLGYRYVDIGFEYDALQLIRKRRLNLTQSQAAGMKATEQRNPDFTILLNAIGPVTDLFGITHPQGYLVAGTEPHVGRCFHRLRLAVNQFLTECRLKAAKLDKQRSDYATRHIFLEHGYWDY